MGSLYFNIFDQAYCNKIIDPEPDKCAVSFITSHVLWEQATAHNNLFSNFLAYSQNDYILKKAPLMIFTYG
jgi:hypothetical protein